MILGAYLDGLSDADLLVRPMPGINPMALQIGHLIASEHGMIEGVLPGISPPLPDGFDAAHKLSAERSASEDNTGFLTKAAYLDLLKAQREATKSAVAAINEADLDLPGPETMRAYAPTVGAVLSMIGNHTLMHVGQFVVLRRKLGLPIAI